MLANKQGSGFPIPMALLKQDKMTNYQEFPLFCLLQKTTAMQIHTAPGYLSFLFHLWILPRKINQVSLVTLIRPEFLDVVVEERVPDKSFKNRIRRFLPQIKDLSQSLP